MEIGEEISFPSFSRKMLISANYVGKSAWLPHFFFVDSNSPCKYLLSHRGPSLAQKPPLIVSITKFSIMTGSSRACCHVIGV